MHRSLRFDLFCLVALAGAACGDSALDAPGPPVRFELHPTSVLLASPGDSATLRVVAFDAEGRQTPAPTATFTTRSLGIEVAQSGAVTRVATEAGSAQVRVEAEGWVATAFVLMATPAEGVVLVPDADVLGPPRAHPDAAGRYTIDLGRTLEAGDLVLATGGAELSGRIVAVEGSKHTVELVAPEVLFEALEIHESFDLAEVPLIVNEATSELFEVSRTPEGAYVADLRGANGLRPTQASGTSAAAQICTFTQQVALQFSAFSTTLDPNLGFDIDYSLATGFERFVLTGDVDAKAEIAPVFTAALQAKAECKVELGILPVPIGGPLAYVFGAFVPFGVGTDLTLKTSTPGVGAKITATATAGVQLGFQCPTDGDCEGVLESGFGASANAQAVLPPAPALEVELAASAFGFADLSLGNSIAAFRLGGLKFGPVQTWKLRSEADQLDDDTFSSTYDLKLALTADASLSAMLGNYINITFAKVERKTEDVWARSPTGTFSFEVDPEDPDRVRGRVHLDEANLLYGFIEDVQAVHFVRYLGGTVDVLGSVAPDSGAQTEFEAEWMTFPGDEGRYFAFVQTLLSPLWLELKRVEVPGCQTDESSVIASARIWGATEHAEVRHGPGVPVSLTGSHGGSSAAVEVTEGRVSVTASGPGASDEPSGIQAEGGSYWPVTILPTETSSTVPLKVRVRFEVEGGFSSGDEHYDDFASLNVSMCFDLECTRLHSADGDSVSGVFVVESEVRPGRERGMSVRAEAVASRVGHASATVRYLGIDGVFDPDDNPVDYTLCTIDGL